MNNIYVPDTSYACYVVYDKDTIRAYHQQPTYDTNIDYTDYFINSHYLERNGVSNFNQYYTLPTCIDKSLLTTDYHYRNDYYSSLIIFIIFAIICFYVPIRILLRFFKKGKL